LPPCRRRKGASGKPRVDDCRVFSGIVHVLKSGCRWADTPLVYRLREPAQRIIITWLNAFECAEARKGTTFSGSRPIRSFEF
jgi:transposase